MPHQLEIDTVQHLVNTNGSDASRAAAKHIAKLDFDVRHVDGPAIDVLARGDHDLISQLTTTDQGTRIERAARAVSPTPIRQFQWVEEGRPQGPIPPAGAGDGPTG